MDQLEQFLCLTDTLLDGTATWMHIINWVSFVFSQPIRLLFPEANKFVNSVKIFVRLNSNSSNEKIMSTILIQNHALNHEQQLPETTKQKIVEEFFKNLDKSKLNQFLENPNHYYKVLDNSLKIAKCYEALGAAAPILFRSPDLVKQLIHYLEYFIHPPSNQTSQANQMNPIDLDDFEVDSI